MVVVVGVAAKPGLDECREALTRGPRSAGHRDRGDGMIDRQPRELTRAGAEQRRRGRRPALDDAGGEVGEARPGAEAVQRRLVRHGAQMLAQRALHEGAVRPRHRKGFSLGRERNEPVRVDGFEADRRLGGRRERHVREERRRVPVRHDGAGAVPQGPDQAAALSPRSLDVGEVVSAAGRQIPGVAGHAFEHELVDAVAGRGVVAAQRLEHDERLTEREATLDRALQAEIRSDPACAGHPVEDEAARGVHRPGVECADPGGWHRRWSHGPHDGLTLTHSLCNS